MGKKQLYLKLAFITSNMNLSLEFQELKNSDYKENYR